MNDLENENHDWVDLADLARTGEQYATPLPVEQVRQLGNRRRTRRRAGIVVAAVAVVAVAGGTLLNGGTLRGDVPPDPATTPTVVTASPSPVRTVGAVNLIGTDDLPVLGKERFVEADAPGDRTGERITVCVPADGYADLKSSTLVSRSFRLDRRADGSKNPALPPLGKDASVLTQALQFDSTEDATAAYKTYRSWLSSCARTIKSTGGSPGRAATNWTAVKTVAHARSGFSEVVWRPAAGPADGGYFESVGLVQVDDRLAVTVSLVWGQDYNVSLDPSGDSDTGLPAHPQFVLLVNASHGLLR